MRCGLVKFNNEITDLPLYVIPVRHHFLFEKETSSISLSLILYSNFRQAEEKINLWEEKIQKRKNKKESTDLQEKH